MFDTQKDFYKKLLGASGEKLAVKYLKKQKYKILEVNYKTHFGEIDVIAQDGQAIVFIEVKTRTSSDYGEPSEAVDYKKRQKYKIVAEEYLMRTGKTDCECRFDAVEVKNKEINHIKDAFFV